MGDLGYRKKIGNLFPHFRNGAVVTETAAALPFDLTAAVAHLSNCDPSIARLVQEAVPFDPNIDHTQSPYEALLESIAYQSISGKAAATISAASRHSAPTEEAPTPQEF